MKFIAKHNVKKLKVFLLFLEGHILQGLAVHQWLFSSSMDIMSA